MLVPLGLLFGRFWDSKLALFGDKKTIKNYMICLSIFNQFWYHFGSQNGPKVHPKVVHSLIWAGLGRVLEPTWATLGPHGPPGTTLGPPMGPLGPPLAPPWVPLGPPWHPKGPSLAPQGAFLALRNARSD